MTPIPSGISARIAPLSRVRKVLTAPLVGMLLLAACGGDSGDGPEGGSGLPRKSIAPPADQPYVSVAVDNHFHDIHLEDNITIEVGRGFIIKNQGSNLHNVTIPQLDFNEDVDTGEQVDFLGDTLAAGTYDIICRYHADQGMVGKLIVE